MKALIIVLIIAAFLQTTILSIDLVLLILICRAYAKAGKENLYLAFAFGIFTAHLNLTSLGLTPLFYLIAVQLTQVLSKFRLAGNPLLLIPVSLVILLLNQVANFYINNQTLQLSKVIFPLFLALPVFYLIKLWEERFIIRKEIKLKI